MNNLHSHDISPDKKTYFVIETEKKLPFKLESSKLTIEDINKLVQDNPNFIAVTYLSTLTISFIQLNEFERIHQENPYIFSEIIVSNELYPTLKKLKNFHHRKSILIVKKSELKKSKKFKVEKSKEKTESFLDKFGLSIRCTETHAKEICTALVKTGLFRSVDNNRCAKFYSKRFANSKGVIELQTNRTQKKFAPLKVLFNPSKANKSEIILVFKTIKKSLDVSYKSIMSKSIISRLDIAQDWYGYSCEEFTLGLSRSTSSEIYINENGKIETKIVGRGRKRFHAYLKRVKGKSCLRVELQLRHARFNGCRIRLANFNKFYHFSQNACLYESYMDETKFSDINTLTSLQYFSKSGLRRTLNANEASSLDYYMNKNKNVKFENSFFTGAMKELKKLTGLIFRFNRVT